MKYIATEITSESDLVRIEVATRLTLLRRFSGSRFFVTRGLLGRETLGWNPDLSGAKNVSPETFIACILLGCDPDDLPKKAITLSCGLAVEPTDEGVSVGPWDFKKHVIEKALSSVDNTDYRLIVEETKFEIESVALTVKYDCDTGRPIEAKLENLNDPARPHRLSSEDIKKILSALT